MYDTVLVFDHVQRTAQVLTLAPLTTESDGEYDRAVVRIDEVMRRLRQPVPTPLSRPGTPSSAVKSNHTQEEFERLVGVAKEHIAAGDAIQVVLSQRFERHTDADPFNIYRALRMVNPSPYMFFLQFGDFYLIGASPEMLVKVQDGRVTTHPIAGTRPRGANGPGDRQLERELLADEKERAEHLMLVDLGRNDIGRIAKTGSVKVPRFMEVDHYSHVMHLVSEVEGELRESLGPADALRACFPAGTVSGAPKVRAMQIISDLERDRRGPYSGATGYIGYDGNMDTAITIRTIVLKDGVASVQAGAGIVADSVPESEYRETQHKARALLSAIDLAEQIEREENALAEGAGLPQAERAAI
jgi:anthranilate synthase component 1